MECIKLPNCNFAQQACTIENMRSMSSKQATTTLHIINIVMIYLFVKRTDVALFYSEVQAFNCPGGHATS